MDCKTEIIHQRESRRVDIGVDEAGKTREKKHREPLQRKDSRWVDIG